MARPRLHDLDGLLDAAEQLLAEGDDRAVTIRAVAERSGASSGSLYHAFGSRNELLGQLWLRAARRFLELQQNVVDAHLAAGSGWDGAVAATVAAATVLRDLNETAPASARVLIRHRREALIADGLPNGLAGDLRDLDGELLAVLRRLAHALFGAAERQTIETVAICVVDLPSALLDGRRPRSIDPAAALGAAVRGILNEARDGLTHTD
ncbi:TetR/AcrR family transcriptional regulator [Patulibacter sp.]|uniref:TetR/AcrR family transcriptional regulator n=1 Tax=Patulibacter sp. TaxID=1912859 RepID=UPI00271F6814|nr:helix-turn-helix domain-containing protein [Patulibacter sp.]MDO9408987.1 helix-turn-helix domain-containing protein [Patulibacter sp.]